MATGSIFVIPSNGANVIQTAPGLPGVALQASGATPYPQYGTQQLGISTSVPQQVSQKVPMQRFLSAEAKVFGAVQIMIGLIHIGFGAVAICLYPYDLTVSGTGGYPFWGGIFFISTGSLCVVAANRSNHDLVESSIGMNIASATVALTGIMMCLYQMIVTTIPQYDTTRIISVSYGLASLLLLFSLLEFCIAVSLGRFACQATGRRVDQPTMLFWPYQVIRGGAVTPEPNPPPPPTYDKVVTKFP
ncbi:membrane-spanning 4-domains subfamily A member 15-like [Protobothrops mucrosquamatus]|uniref:membrane-spanning 4-domains subfamily A member 15-like n=1 Tax=Protobothrops mucrosquamatus TaxID=103944 RepID=UPI0007759D69|nr:membrane-spanning 4-domains subfamily A member 15-like [Protobothrops mucrosquamatus]